MKTTIKTGNTEKEINLPETNPITGKYEIETKEFNMPERIKTKETNVPRETKKNMTKVLQTFSSIIKTLNREEYISEEKTVILQQILNTAIQKHTEKMYKF